MNIHWKNITELKQQELFLLQQSYEEREEIRQKVLCKSQTLIAASNAVNKLCEAAKGLKFLLDECHNLILLEDNDTNAQTDDAKVQECDLGFTFSSFNKDWLVELLLQEDSLESAMLIDMCNKRIAGHILDKLATHPTERLVHYFSLNTQPQSITHLASSIEVNMKSSHLKPILQSFLAPLSITLTPCTASSISYALNLNLKPRLIKLDIKGDPEDIECIIKARESATTARLVSQLESKTHDSDIVATLLQATEELEHTSQQLVELVKSQLKGYEALKFIELLSRFPLAYQQALSEEALEKLDSHKEQLDVDIDLLHDPMVRARIKQGKSKSFEDALMKKLGDDKQSDSLKILFDATTTIPTEYSPSEEMMKSITKHVSLNDLKAMRLLLYPFTTSKDQTNDQKPDCLPSTTYDLLPSPNTFSSLQRIPVKAEKGDDHPLHNTFDTNTPNILSTTAQSPSPQIQSSTKKDPLQSLKKMLQF